MPPIIATLLWLVLLLVLLWFDPAKVPGTSWALWVPLIWMFIIGSRLPSQWLGGTSAAVASVLEEGNPLDRTTYFILIVLALVILILRSFRWDKFFSHNFALVAFVGFGLVSVVWSDFPFVAFKRWFRDLGSYFVILVVLSDSRPLEAVRTVLRRLAYLLIPLSILLNKYYPHVSKQYDQWTGAGMFAGATTSKNMLGVLCLVSGIFFFWDTVTRWKERKEKRTKRILLVNFAFLGMTLWLLSVSNSATSHVCLVIGCVVILATHSKLFQRHPAFAKSLIPLAFCLYLVLAFGLDFMGDLAGAVGRDATLTDRTALWKLLLNMHTNPLIGTGYESFWLGSRLQWVWRQFAPGINEAHDGFLDVFLTLGIIGLCLLTMFLISSYRIVWRRFRSPSSLGPLALALWAILPFYNITEAAFKAGLMWVVFLLGAVAIPEPAEDSAAAAAAFGNASVAGRLHRLPLEPTSFRK